MDQAAGVGSGCQVGQMAISLGLEGTGPGGGRGYEAGAGGWSMQKFIGTIGAQ